MTDLDRLIEAIEFASENDQEWYELFESCAEAEEVLLEAEKQEPEEWQIAVLLTLFEDDEIFNEDINKIFRKCIKKLKRQLKRTIPPEE